MDYGDISNTQLNEPFETINEIDFACPECKKNFFLLKKNLIRHVKSSHSATSFIFPACRITFKRMDNLKRHHLKAHGQPFVKTAEVLLPVNQAECPIQRRKMLLQHLLSSAQFVTKTVRQSMD
ncbi:hypothetical protein NPIL_675701 [Nephila pilipes]|uniref:C2H2-type domain-containing protein n=1 Tax=Nephila pilipes TaxID=299642 RepID=A0A8X6TRK2_NEPPI|nr:hypothetical protein NPIL_675701 [Nephila pilipes]